MKISLNCTLAIAFGLISSCENRRQSEIFDAKQERTNLIIILYNYQTKHEMKYPSNIEELLQYDFSQYGDKNALDLKQGWTYNMPPDNLSDSNFVVLEKETKWGDVFDIKIKDLK